MLRRFATALVVAASTVVAIGAASPAAHASDAGTFVSQINADRAKAGRAPLAHRPDLAAVALRHAKLMAAKNSLHHNKALASQISNWRAVGENVGMGGNARVLHTAFMNSPAHRANVLDRDYSEVGIGVTIDARGIMWVTEVFRQPTRSVTALRVIRKPAVSPKAAPVRRTVAVRRPATRLAAVRWLGATRTAQSTSTPSSAWLHRAATIGA